MRCGAGGAPEGHGARLLLWSRKPEGEAVAERFLEALPTIDFSHPNPPWDIERMDDATIESGYP